MDAIRVGTSHFSGQSKVFDRGPDGLAAIVRGLAMDNARLALLSANVGSLTDNSGGTPRSRMIAVVDLMGTDASGSALGAGKADFDAAINTVEAAMVALAQKLNLARTRLGLPVLVYSGAPAAAGTIPAITKNLAGRQGNATVSLATARRAVMQTFVALDLLEAATGSVLAALGFARVPSDLRTGYSGLTIPDFTASTASADGKDAASVTSVNAALTALADGIATLAGTFNGMLSDEAQSVTPLHVVAA